MMKGITYITVMALVALALAGCGGGGGSDGGAGNSGATYKGQAFDAAIANGVVKVKTLGGKVVATSTTDGAGRFSVVVPASGPYLIFEVGEGSYFEQATGEKVFLAGEVMTAVVESGSSNRFVSINALSHLQAGIFEYRRVNVFNGNADAAFNEARNALKGYVGFEPSTVSLVDLSAVVSFSSINGAAKASLYSAGISQFISNLISADGFEGQQNGSQYSSISFIQRMYQDAIADGQLDGQGGNGQLFIGGWELDSNTYRDGLALSMIQFVKSGSNQSDIALIDMLDFAVRMSGLSNGETYFLFGSQAPNSLSNEGPIISNLIPGDQSPVYGNAQFTFDVTDFAGIKKLSFSFGGEDPQTTSNFESPIFQVSTGNYADGVYDVVIEATSLSDGVTIETYQVFVSNDGTTISNLKPTEGQIIRGSYQFSVDMYDAIGITYKAFHIDDELLTGWSQTATGYRRVVDTTAYADGAHTFTAWAQNSVGAEEEEQVSFVIDNTAPEVSNYPVGEGDYLEGNVLFSLAVSDPSGIESAILKVDGAQVGANLDQSNFTLESASYAEGEHTVTFIAKDSVGNTTTIQNTLFVDNLPPAVDIYYPQDGITVTAGFTAFWNVQDEGASEDNVDNPDCGRTADFDGTHYPGCTYLYVGGSIYSGSFLREQDSRSINIFNRPSGWNEVRVVAVDLNGTEAEDTINVYFDY